MKTVNRMIALGAAALMGIGLISCGGEKETAFDYSKGLDDNGFFEGVKAAELVTLPEYKGLDIDASLLVAAEEDVQIQIDGVMSSYGAYEQIKDRAVEDGDSVNIDYVGSIDGVEFEGGSTGGMGTSVTIGVTSYIDDFLEQLIGHMPGETINVEVTFPEDYGKEDLNGKDAVFVTTINYIEGELADLSDEIAAEYGFATKEEMIADIENWLISNQKFAFFTELLEGAACESIPQSVLDFVIDYDLEQQNYFANMYYGMTGEQYITQMGFASVDAYINANMEMYTENARLYLAAQAIAENEGISVTDEELDQSSYAAAIEQYGRPYLKQYILFQEKVPDFIIENGNVK